MPITDHDLALERSASRALWTIEDHGSMGAFWMFVGIRVADASVGKGGKRRYLTTGLTGEVASSSFLPSEV